MRKSLVLLVVLLAATWIPGIAQSNANGVAPWQIGTPDGNVSPIDGSLEYPASGAWTPTFDYYVGTDSDPINFPSMPGYIGPDNVCEFAGGRPCTDTTAELIINFTLNCDYGAGELTLVYDRYGSESDKLFLDEEVEPFATISGTEGGFRQFSFDLGPISAGDHTITIQYAGGGSGNGHYIDYLKLTTPFLCVPADIKPTSCPNPLNTKSKGVLPAAILGTWDFDVTQVNLDTLSLVIGESIVEPLWWSLEDVATPFEPFRSKGDCVEDCNDLGPDGILDLTLKFDTQEVVAALQKFDVTDGECFVVSFEGYLTEEFGNTRIKAEDVILILDKRNAEAKQEKKEKKGK